MGGDGGSEVKKECEVVREGVVCEWGSEEGSERGGV